MTPLRLNSRTWGWWICATCAGLLAAAGCNRNAEADDWGAGFSDGGDEDGADEEGVDDAGENPDYPEGCGDGVAEAGEFCHKLVAEPDSGIDPCSLSVADFDLDGHVDIAVPNSDWLLDAAGTFEANVLFGNGNATVADSRAWQAGDRLPVGLAVGDVDGDGFTDVVTSNFESRTAVWLRNLGDGTFAPPVDSQTGSDALSAQAGDVNRDGFADILVVTNAGLELALGGPAGLRPFDEVRLLDDEGQDEDPWFGPSYANLVDIDQDGRQDLVVTEHSGRLSISQGNGEGGFGDTVWHEVGAGPVWLTVADLSGDGDLDLVVANHDEDTVSVLTGNNHGGFAAHRRYDTGFGPNSVAVGDFDADGWQDIVTTNDVSDSVTVLLHEGPERYELGYTYAGGIRPVSIQVADFNEDGIADFAWAQQLSNKVAIVASDP